MKAHYRSQSYGQTLLVAVLLTTACAAGSVQPVLNPAEKKEAAKVSSDDYQDAVVLQASRDRIADRFLREKHALEGCLTDGSSPKVCFNLRKSYCEVSVLLDSQGTMHHKPYCD